MATCISLQVILCANVCVGGGGVQDVYICLYMYFAYGCVCAFTYGCGVVG